MAKQYIPGKIEVMASADIPQQGNKLWLQAQDGKAPVLKAYNNNTGTYDPVVPFWIGTQAEYDALGTYDSDTIYLIEEAV